MIFKGPGTASRRSPAVRGRPRIPAATRALGPITRYLWLPSPPSRDPPTCYDLRDPCRQRASLSHSGQPVDLWGRCTDTPPSVSPAVTCRGSCHATLASQTGRSSSGLLPDTRHRLEPIRSLLQQVTRELTGIHPQAAPTVPSLSPSTSVLPSTASEGLSASRVWSSNAIRPPSCLRRAACDPCVTKRSARMAALACRRSCARVDARLDCTMWTFRFLSPSLYFITTSVHRFYPLFSWSLKLVCSKRRLGQRAA